MKDQYIGDHKDYYKFSFLRHLALDGIRISICWMLTPPARSTDGGDVDYLTPKKTKEGNAHYEWKQYDPEVFDALRRCVVNDKRKVTEIERRKVIPGARYFYGMFPDSLDGFRDSYWANFDAHLTTFAERGEPSDVVFFDPDKGLRHRTNPGTPSENLFFDELSEYYLRGYSLFVIQFPWREENFKRNRCQQLANEIQELANTDIRDHSWCFHFRTLGKRTKTGGRTPPHSIFFYLVAQENQDSRFNELIGSFRQKWRSCQIGNLPALEIHKLSTLLGEGPDENS